jgi:DNA-binding transcriptional MerR regulator
MDRKTNFTIGEFAALFGISKQTLFYYERNKIFEPYFVDENGYRYYSLGQYFIFEIIFTMRKLGFSLHEIAAYVKNRNLEALENLYIQKQEEFKYQIQILQKNIQNLDAKIHRLERTKKILVDKITLEDCEEEYLVVSTFHNLKASMKEQIVEIARHNLPFAASPIMYEYLFGYILDHKNLLAGNYLNMTQIYTKVVEPDLADNMQVRPAGLYATIYTSKGYHTAYRDALEKLKKFIDRNDLKIVGNAYIMPLRNYWSTDKPADYITQLAVQVDYK